MFIKFCSNAPNPNPLNTDNNRKWELKTPEVIVLLLLFHSCCNQSRKCSLSSNTMSLPYKSIIKKFRHACTSCRGGKEPCLPFQPLWCHLKPHFLTGLEDLSINFLKTPSPFPPHHHHLHHHIPAPASLSHPAWRIATSTTFFTPLSAQTTEIAARLSEQSPFLYSVRKKAIRSRSWKWWRRRSKPCSNKLMRRRSVSWRYKGSWTVSWNCAKKWENSRICSPFPFFREKKITFYCQRSWYYQGFKRVWDLV